MFVLKPKTASLREIRASLNAIVLHDEPFVSGENKMHLSDSNRPHNDPVAKSVLHSGRSATAYEDFGIYTL